MRFTLNLIVLFLVNICSPLAASELYEEKRIAEIQVERDSRDPAGNCDSRAVLVKMRTKVGDRFSQFVFDSDLKALSEDYDRVYPSIRVIGDQVYIVVRVTPRPLIHQITFVGNNRYTEGTLSKELDVKPYTIFHREEFQTSLNKVKEYYIKKGYFESQIRYVLRPLPSSDEVDVEIQIREGRVGRIRSVTFEGLDKKEEKELTEVLFLKRYTPFTSWLTGTGIFREEGLEQDEMAILNYLHNHGYADARVKAEIFDSASEEGIDLVFEIDHGSVYRIGCVTVEGNQLMNQQEVLSHLGIATGDVYSPEKLREATQAVKDLYGKKGHIEATVQYESHPREDETVFDLDFVVDEGDQYKIGMIHIFGNRSTHSNVILRESLLVPGCSFDSRKLRATQQRLEGMGYFKSVNVYAVRSNDPSLGRNYRDVYIEVDESPTGSVNLFAGFSSTDDVSGGLELTERNFNIAGLGKALTGRISALRGGGQYFHIRVTEGKKQSNYLISWMNPYVNDSLWRLGVELSRTFSELQSKNTKVRTYGGSVYANYPLTTYWTTGLRQRVRHTSTLLSLNNPDNSSVAATSIEEDKEQNAGQGLLSALSANLAYDSTNSPRKPRQGIRGYLEGEYVGLGGEYHFLKWSYQNTYYIPVTKTGTLKLRGELKFLSPFGKKSPEEDVPYSERLFLGGEGTVRGYKPFILGPKIAIEEASGKDKVTSTPKGGLSSCLLTAEYNQEILKILDGFVFFDAGSVTFDRWSVETLRCAVGAGIRLEVNRNPMVVGYGFPLNSASKNDEQRVFFSMSGQF